MKASEVTRLKKRV